MTDNLWQPVWHHFVNASTQYTVNPPYISLNIQSHPLWFRMIDNLWQPAIWYQYECINTVHSQPSYYLTYYLTSYCLMGFKLMVSYLIVEWYPSFVFESRTYLSRCWRLRFQCFRTASFDWLRGWWCRGCCWRMTSFLGRGDWARGSATR